jgi:hypothetical protein
MLGTMIIHKNALDAKKNSNNQMRKMRNIRQEDDRILDRKIGLVNNHRRMQEYWTWGRKEIFFIMYFSLPDSIPPRPLGGARVRKH